MSSDHFHVYGELLPEFEKEFREAFARRDPKIVYPETNIALKQRGIYPTISAEALLERMVDKIDWLCAERDRLKAELPKTKGKVLGGRKWYSGATTLTPLINPPWIKALAAVRQRAMREGWCYQHVQAIAVAIDQYAEAAFGNRDYFLNKPYSIGGDRNGRVP
jgi:hypothetical protein